MCGVYFVSVHVSDVCVPERFLCEKTLRRDVELDYFLTIFISKEPKHTLGNLEPLLGFIRLSGKWF